MIDVAYENWSLFHKTSIEKNWFLFKMSPFSDAHVLRNRTTRDTDKNFSRRQLRTAK